MRALIVAVGTRGDVQPALALAEALIGRGHGVRMCTSPGFVDAARALGVDARPMGVEMRPGAPPPPPGLDLITDQFDTVGAAAPGCDVILGANAHQYAGPSIAEALGIPCITAVYAPVVVPNASLAPPGPDQPGTVAERWDAQRAAWNARARDRIAENRGRLGLSGIDDVLGHVLTRPTWLAADPVLAPMPPADVPVETVGAWFTPGAAPLPEDVRAFVETGDPPVYVGFGSMPAAPALAVAALDAARALGRRLILARGWSALDAPSAPDCLVVDAVDHDALFPHVAAAVHHGGAGTVHTAARAGVPQLVVPMYSDQFYWAGRVEALGIGARATPADLADGLHAVLACAGRAAEVRSALGDSGVSGTVDRLEALA